MPKYGDPPFQTAGGGAAAAVNGNGTTPANGQVHIDEEEDERSVRVVCVDEPILNRQFHVYNSTVVSPLFICYFRNVGIKKIVQCTNI